MLNRVIYGGEVYYKVADLAELFESSVYKMRKAVKELEIGEPLKGFGRMVFVSEKNVAKIDVDGKTAKVKTTVREKGRKFMKEIAGATENGVIEAPLDKTFTEAFNEDFEARRKQAELEKIESETETQECKENVEAPVAEHEKLQMEHAELTKTARDWVLKYKEIGKFGLLNDISYNHCGEGFDLNNSTLEDIDGLKATIAELESKYEEVTEESLVF